MTSISECIALCFKECLVSSLGSGSPPPQKKRDVLKDRVCQSHPKTQHHIPGGLDLQHSLITEFKTLLQCNLFADIWWTLPFRDGTHYWPLRQVMKTILGINHLCYWAAPHSAIGKRLVREPDSMNWQATCLLPLVYTVTKHEVMCNIQGSHSSISEDFTLLGCDTVFSGGPLEQVSLPSTWGSSRPRKPDCLTLKMKAV